MTVYRIVITVTLALNIALAFAQNTMPANADACVSGFSLTAPVEVEKEFIPSGWMGDAANGKQFVQMNFVSGEKARTKESGNVVMKVHYQGGSIGWAGAYWQWPANNWGDKPAKRIKGASKVTFWAAGQQGGEIVEFKAGNPASKPCHDSFEASLGHIALTRQWKRYEIPLRTSIGKPLVIFGAFAWVAEASPAGLTFYIDSVRYE